MPHRLAGRNAGRGRPPATAGSGQGASTPRPACPTSPRGPGAYATRPQGFSLLPSCRLQARWTRTRPGVPRPAELWVQKLWPQRPATALSPRSSQRTSGRRERPQCSCSPRATSRRMGQMVPLSLSTFTKHSSGYPVQHFRGLRAPRLSTRILPLVRRDTDLHAHACVCVIFNSVKSTSPSEPARQTPGNRAAGHGVQRRPPLRPSSPRATGISLRNSSGNMLFTAPDDSGEKQDSQLPRPLQIPLVSAHYMPDSCKG